MLSPRFSERCRVRRRGPVRNGIAWSVCLLLLAGGLLLSTGAWAHEPPKNLKKVGDHWTAWDPPMDLPPDAEVHIIQSGDTLWDLAEAFLGNPYLWPQIWERNSYILDAHWIYPGDPLVLGIRVEPQESLEMTALDRPESTDVEEQTFRFGDAYGEIQQLGSADDIFCSGFIGEDQEEFSTRVASSEYDYLSPTLKGLRKTVKGRYGVTDSIQYNLAVGDIVYLDGGRNIGLAAGDLYTGVEPKHLVRHPATQDVVGRLYTYLGRVRVLSVQDESAIAEVVYSCAPIKVGTALIPFDREPVPTERRSPLRPVNYPSPKEALEGAPRVLYAKDGLISIGQDHVVFMDLAGIDAIPGDVFTVYRVPEDGDMPIVIGEVGVLSVHARSAVAKVLESRYPLYVGDVLELK